MKNLAQFLLRVLILSVIGIAIVGLIGLIARWQAVTQFSDGLFWAGAALAGIGILSSFGNKDTGMSVGSRSLWSSPQEKMARLSGAEDPTEQTKRTSMMTGSGFRSYLVLFLSATLVILIGYLITLF